ncbi:TonB-dependent receptor plug domain-containing protein [Pelagicoccus sp. SDUM812005]|uniref:TonB-dependent siderophore receptor n=1 Tax=Pelagicoccus sp. SDUM812005 TaxID=3041257 RepID=UPI0028107960|nr:TonB-dependent receptor plug domain-containing protein [Pelagicoccus sp. SDUM812005]MDQ8183126.1 hypothetical protein [Pelagicoccus sp. SDUM812005]
MKDTPPRNTLRWKSLSLCPLALLALPIAAFAQTSDEDEVYELSPFVVDGSEDNGYRAANTLAGTRMNAQLKDTAASVSTFTKAFLEDLGATDLESVMNYSASAEKSVGDTSPNPGGNDNVDSKPGYNFRVRGFQSSRARNFFRYDLPVDVFNTERLDESRGPNSILFGVGSAGGIVNVATKQAFTNQDFTRLQFQLASENGRRGALDLNKTLIEDKLAIRFNLLKDSSDGWRYSTNEEDERIHAAATYKLAEKTTLRAEFELGAVDDVVARPYQITDDYSQWDGTTFASGVWTTPPGARRSQWWGGTVPTYVSNSGTVVDTRSQMETINSHNPISDFPNYSAWWNAASGDTNVIPESIIPASVNVAGPGAKRELDYNTHTFIAEQQLGDLFVELAYHRTESDWVSHWTESSSLQIDPNENRIDGSPNPFVGQYYLEGRWDKRTRNISSDTYRATLGYKLDTERMGTHNFVAMWSKDDQIQAFTNETLAITDEDIIGSWGATPDNARYRPAFRQYFTELGDWENFHIPSWETRINGAPTLSNNALYDDKTVSMDWIIRDQNQNDDRVDTDSILLGAQSYWMDKKLVTTLGYRSDKVENLTHDTVRGDDGYYMIDYDSPNLQDFDSETITAGGVYHLTDTFSLFYNRSENTNYPNFLISVLPEDLTRPIQTGTPEPPQGSGWDAGIMFQLMDNKITGRLTYYEAEVMDTENWSYGWNITTSRENGILNLLVDRDFIDQETADIRYIDSNGTLFDEESSGWELTSTANLSKNWRLNFNASSTDRIRFNAYADAERLLDSSKEWVLGLDGINGSTEVGSSPTPGEPGETVDQFYDRWMSDLLFYRRGEEVKRGLREFKYNLFTAYDFTEGKAKGLTIGGGLRYQSANIVGVDGEGNILKGDDLSYVDLMLRYRFKQKLFGKAATSIQLNVNNLFEKEGLIPVRYAPVQGENYSNPDIVDAATFHDPQSVRLTFNVHM